jgi:hypothetical protein
LTAACLVRLVPALFGILPPVAAEVVGIDEEGEQATQRFIEFTTTVQLRENLLADSQVECRRQAGVVRSDALAGERDESGDFVYHAVAEVEVVTLEQAVEADQPVGIGRA